MRRKQKGFTLLEIMITTGVGVLIASGVLMTIIRSMILDEYNAKFSIAMNIARTQLEEMFSNRSDFDSIKTIVSQPLTMAQDGIDGAYRVEVSEVIPDELVDVRALACWKGRGRVWGDSCTCDENGCAFDESLCDNSKTPPQCKGQVDIQTSIAKRG